MSTFAIVSEAKNIYPDKNDPDKTGNMKTPL